ncbi:MAG: hypothetical protein Kow0037_30270 [Calditrichia bacterium]
MTRKMKTALVLGGGGARGLSHLGVLKVLEQENRLPDMIVGCSMGSVIGAMYAQLGSTKAVEEKLRRFFASEAYIDLNVDLLERHRNGEESKDFIQQIARNAVRRVMINLVASRVSILKEEQVERVVNALIEPGKIEDTKIPFACNATDLVSGQAVLFRDGDIRKAVKASSSIPGYLPPVVIDNQVLVDGAVTDSVPTRFARILGADRIIAVDVRQNLKPQKEFRNVFDVVMRAATVTSNRLTEETSDLADLTIYPAVGDYMWYDFRDIDLLIKAGEDATHLQWEQLNRLLTPPKKSFWRKIFGKN